MVREPDPDAVRLTDDLRAMVWHFASLLLARPDESLVGRLEPVHRASHLLPDVVGGPLRATVVHLEQVPITQLQQEYAETFTRLTTGMSGGADVIDDLCAKLEKAATAEPGLGRSVLADQQSTLRTLRAALLDAESGWAGAVTAVTATLARSDGAREAMPGRAR